MGVRNMSDHVEALSLDAVELAQARIQVARVEDPHVVLLDAPGLLQLLVGLPRFQELRALDGEVVNGCLRPPVVLAPLLDDGDDLVCHADRSLPAERHRVDQQVLVVGLLVSCYCEYCNAEAALHFPSSSALSFSVGASLLA